MSVKTSSFFFIPVGKYKTQVISACRGAIKSNNVSALFKIMKTGAS